MTCKKKIIYLGKYDIPFNIKGQFPASNKNFIVYIPYTENLQFTLFIKSKSLGRYLLSVKTFGVHTSPTNYFLIKIIRNKIINFNKIIYYAI